MPRRWCLIPRISHTARPDFLLANPGNPLALFMPRAINHRMRPEAICAASGKPESETDILG